MHTSGAVKETSVAETASIDELAASWLAAERDAIAKANEPRSERAARDAAAAYEDAIRTATVEELLLALVAARLVQAKQDMGSQEWLECRSVSELLRTEYEAMRSAS